MGFCCKQGEVLEMSVFKLNNLTNEASLLLQNLHKDCKSMCCFHIKHTIISAAVKKTRWEHHHTRQKAENFKQWTSVLKDTVNIHFTDVTANSFAVVNDKATKMFVGKLHTKSCKGHWLKAETTWKVKYNFLKMICMKASRHAHHRKHYPHFNTVLKIIPLKCAEVRLFMY